jgi:hypothetical protein
MMQDIMPIIPLDGNIDSHPMVEDGMHLIYHMEKEVYDDSKQDCDKGDRQQELEALDID